MIEHANGASSDGGAKSREPAPDPLDLSARLDRFGQIVGRGLDLAEAGMTLGLTVLGTLGTAAQTKVLERVLNPGGTGTAEDASAAQHAREAERTEASPSYGIANRLPIRVGGAVAVSFSVNNESPDATKNVRVIVERFVGERSAATLPPDCLAVRPGEQAIAPMDFEKFMLEGRIPEGTVPDRYRGSVVVAGEEPMRIPVLLTVEGQG